MFSLRPLAPNGDSNASNPTITSPALPPHGSPLCIRPGSIIAEWAPRVWGGCPALLVCVMEACRCLAILALTLAVVRAGIKPVKAASRRGTGGRASSRRRAVRTNKSTVCCCCCCCYGGDVWFHCVMSLHGWGVVRGVGVWWCIKPATSYFCCSACCVKLF